MLEPKKLFGGAILLVAAGLLAGCAAPAGRHWGAPASASTPLGHTVSHGAVTLYGAEWCAPCHDAALYLKVRGVKVAVRDVGGDPVAQAEMRSKLDGAGLVASAIPVLDVSGKILVGFDPGALDRALRH